MITSGQLFEKVSCSVIPNNWKLKDILLTLRDIVNYYSGTELVTLQKRIPHPSDKRFFYVHSFLSMVECARNTTRESGITPPDFCQVTSTRPPEFFVGQFPSKEQIK